MSAAAEQPPWSPWLLRFILKGVAACCGILSAGCMIFFFWVLSLLARNRSLLPITLLLLPVALECHPVGLPLVEHCGCLRLTAPSTRRGLRQDRC